MNILYIDTSDRHKTLIKLKVNGKKFESFSDSKAKSQVTLELVDATLKKAGINLVDIDTIEVNRGPGSFTGLRVGLIIANTLAFLLKKKVNGVQQSTIVLPAYE